MSEFDDPFGLHRHSQPTGRVDQDGREIRLIGKPILAWNPATNNLSVPDEYRQHTMIRERYFYTLPMDVLDAVVAAVGSDRFDAGLLAMERELSRRCGDHRFNVGFWQDVAICYGELRPDEVDSFPEELVLQSKQNPVAVDSGLRTYRERDVEALERFSRGYCGWLMTNKQFLDEHDELLTNHADTVRRWGTDRMATFLPESVRSRMIPDTDPNQDPLWEEFVTDCNLFLPRWRLAGLAGPHLPMPSKPLMAGAFPTGIAEQLMGTGGIFYLPDTMPIPSRDQIRSMLDHALHRRESVTHLDEWLDIVRVDNMAKNKMDPFVRKFELQHYWRILLGRHPSVINRKIGELEGVLGKVFDVSAKQIKLDLIDIRKKLGQDWLERGCSILN